MRHPTYISTYIQSIHTCGFKDSNPSQRFQYKQVNCFIYFVYIYCNFNSISRLIPIWCLTKENPPSKQTNHFSCRYRCRKMNFSVDLDTLFIKPVESMNKTFIRAVQVKVNFLGHNCAPLSGSRLTYLQKDKILLGFLHLDISSP